MDVKIAWLDNTPTKDLEKVLDVNSQIGTEMLKWFSLKNLGEAPTNIPFICKINIPPLGGGEISREIEK
jgi:hypothetical protein